MLGLCATIVKLSAPAMPTNANAEAAWNYHEVTKHSYTSVRTNPHFLDFRNQPLPFKIYPALEPSRMPTEVRQTGVAALSAISGSVPAQTNAAPDLEAVAQLLYLSAGITRQRKYSGGEIYFRAAACTGALYEVEVYLVCREPAIAHAPLTIVCTCTYWRNAWKYQARTYRHFGWDNGTMLANLLAVATALGLPAKVICGFVDATVNGLLDVDSQREVAFSLVAVCHNNGISAQTAPPAPTTPRTLAEISPLGFETVPLSRDEVDYPLMREMHAASSLDSPEEVAAWRGRAPLGNAGMPGFPSPAGPVVRLQPLSDGEMPRDPIEQVILRRGSSRQFARTPISLAQLSTVLDRATRGVPADFVAANFEDPVGSQINHLYLIVHAVE